MPLFTCLFSLRYFPFARLWMTITCIIRGVYNLNEWSRFHSSVECHVTQAWLIDGRLRNTFIMYFRYKLWQCNTCVYIQRQVFWLSINISHGLSFNMLHLSYISCAFMIHTWYIHYKFERKTQVTLSEKRNVQYNDNWNVKLNSQLNQMYLRARLILFV